MQPVGNILVDALSLFWGNKGRDDEVDVGEAKDDGDGESRFDGRPEVGEFALVEVNIDETGGDEKVNDGEGIGDDVEDKIWMWVSI